jgi:hypothetical protein
MLKQEQVQPLLLGGAGLLHCPLQHSPLQQQEHWHHHCQPAHSQLLDHQQQLSPSPIASIVPWLIPQGVTGQ